MAWPVGNTVRNPGALGWVTVTVKATAETPVAGTPPRPVTCRFRVAPGPIAAAGAPVPSRVSRMRAGVTGWKPAGDGSPPPSGPAGTPAMAWVGPADMCIVVRAA